MITGSLLERYARPGGAGDQAHTVYFSPIAQQRGGIKERVPARDGRGRLVALHDADLVKLFDVVAFLHRPADAAEAEAEAEAKAEAEAAAAAAAGTARVGVDQTRG